MKLEDQFCLFEQSKKLIELGVETNSLFSFFIFRNESSPPEQRQTVRRVLELSGRFESYSDRSFLKDLFSFPAYTSSELGLMLPDDCRTYRLDERWQSYYPIEGVMNMHLPFADENLTEASAKASLLIFLLEKKLITIT
jgi:hypothetical protein